MGDIELINAKLDYLTKPLTKMLKETKKEIKQALKVSRWNAKCSKKREYNHWLVD